MQARVHVNGEGQALPEARALDLEVGAHELQLVPQGGEAVLRPAQRVAQHVGQALDRAVGQGRVLPDEPGHRVQRIEEEVGADLGVQRLQLGLAGVQAQLPLPRLQADQSQRRARHLGQGGEQRGVLAQERDAIGAWTHAHPPVVLARDREHGGDGTGRHGARRREHLGGRPEEPRQLRLGTGDQGLLPGRPLQRREEALDGLGRAPAPAQPPGIDEAAERARQPGERSRHREERQRHHPGPQAPQRDRRQEALGQGQRSGEQHGRDRQQDAPLEEAVVEGEPVLEVRAHQQEGQGRGAEQDAHHLAEGHPARLQHHHEGGEQEHDPSGSRCRAVPCVLGRAGPLARERRRRAARR